MIPMTGGFDNTLDYNLPVELDIVKQFPDWIYSLGLYSILAAVAYIAILMALRAWTSHNPQIGSKTAWVLGAAIVLGNATSILATFLTPAATPPA